MKSRREEVAKAIYAAAFAPSSPEEARRERPSPGWFWEKTSEQQRQFCLKQADAAIAASDAWVAATTRS